MTFSLKLFFLLTGVVNVSRVLAQTYSEDPSFSDPHSIRISAKEMTAVILALEDDIYVNRQQAFFRHSGRAQIGATGEGRVLRLFVEPRINSHRSGRVIYIDEPFGEIIRIFDVQLDGLVVLDSSPAVGFPITQPSHQTSVMEPRKRCNFKSTWLQKRFKVLLSPSKLVVEEAGERQKKRISFWNFNTD